jgi:diguanylate cyclase (GGDEF)-like protein
MAVCMLDLDGFKAVNDGYGHASGDLLLVEVAKRLRDILRGEDVRE